MERRAPQRLVGVDVPEPRDDPLVEQNGLDRRAPGRQPRGEPVRREAGTERLGAVLPGEEWIQLGVLEDEPRPEATDVAVREPRPVVELEDGPLVARPPARGAPPPAGGGGRARGAL